MNQSDVLKHTDQGVTTITLNRASKRNALTRDMILQMTAAVSDTDVRDSRAVVLNAAGSVFCAGMDLGEMQSRAADPDRHNQWQRDAEVYRDLLLALWAVPCPLIGVVQGAAVAGGVGLVLTCDLVIASEQAFFALPEPRRGITAAMVTPLLLYRLGVAASSSLLLSGENISAVHASRLGLCHDVVVADQLETRLQSALFQQVTSAPNAMRETKQHLRTCSAAELAAFLEQSMKVSAQARATDEAAEGLAAFLEKRHPSWLPTK